MPDSGKPSIWEWTALHKAGHAVAAIVRNIGFSRVEMDNQVLTRENQFNLGGVVFNEAPPFWLTGFDPRNPSHRRRAENWVVVALAGEASESFMEGRECDMLRPSALDDNEIIIKCAVLLHADTDAQAAFIEGQKRIACDLVRQPLRRHQIGVVASHLETKREVAYAEAVRLLVNMKVKLRDLGLVIHNDETDG